jgi:hypothetical protein
MLQGGGGGCLLIRKMVVCQGRKAGLGDRMEIFGLLED